MHVAESTDNQTSQVLPIQTLTSSKTTPKAKGKREINGKTH